MIVGIGYNGNARGLDNDCDTAEPGFCGCIHAEVNALLKAPYQGGPYVLYTTCSPCVPCAKLILNSAVKVVYYAEAYRDIAGITLLQAHGVDVFTEADASNQSG